MNIPREVEEAALLDGAGKIKIFFRVVLPMASTPIITLSVLTYITSWNDYFWPLMVSYSDSSRVLTVALAVFRAQTPAAGVDWSGLMAATLIAALPMLVLFARVAFAEVNPRLEQIARTLGASRWRVFVTITLPLAARGIVAGMILAFARALGEFGATIMVAGNIPGKTSTLSLAIFQNVQLGEDAHAFRLLGVSVVLAFLAVWSSQLLLRKRGKAK